MPIRSHVIEADGLGIYRLASSVAAAWVGEMRVLVRRGGWVKAQRLFEHPAKERRLEERLPSWSSGGQCLLFVFHEEVFRFGMEVAGMSLWNTHRAKQGSESPVGVQIAGSQRDGAFAMPHQSTGGYANRREPIGDILWIADGGRE